MKASRAGMRVVASRGASHADGVKNEVSTFVAFCHQGPARAARDAALVRRSLALLDLARQHVSVPNRTGGGRVGLARPLLSLRTQHAAPSIIVATGSVLMFSTAATFLFVWLVWLFSDTRGQ